jgi:NAD(P)-dependent dehydrogenase (short-subunit alcohol dehydrogenase family)
VEWHGQRFTVNGQRTGINYQSTSSMEFKNKTAIVTGAGQGIGFEICLSLAKEGARVVLNDIDWELAAKAAEQLNREYKDSCFAVAGDASNMAVIHKLVEEAVTRYGQLNLVIANAGITLFGDFLSYSPEAFLKVMQVNLGGSFFLAQAAANQMIKQASGGSILFMSSVTGHQAHKKLAAYGMSKAALEMLAKNLVIELSEYHINVNAIAPGATLTERTLRDPAYIKTWSNITPMGRPASTKDIADTALFLVSEKARHISGQTVVVDGGWTVVSPPPNEK